MKTRQYQPLTVAMRDRGVTTPPACLGSKMSRHRDSPCLACCAWRVCLRKRLGEPPEDNQLEAYL